MNTYHIIDHKGFGTIHRLLIPLCEKYNDHKLYTTDPEHDPLTESVMDHIKNDSDSFIIVHSTGNMKTNLIQNFRKCFPDNPAAFFLHTSYKYQELKGRGDMVHELRRLTSRYQMDVLLPSKETAKQYSDLGIPAHDVQLGIPSIESEVKYLKYRPELAPYYYKIITTCSSEQPIYKYVKGIDLFEQMITELHLKKDALIAGIDGTCDSGIPMKKFSTDDFLNILCHAKAYVQLSRYETYNLTAVQAKQFMVPALVLGVEGAQSCMKEYAYSSLEDVAEDLKKAANYEADLEAIIFNKQDSIRRESLENFHFALARSCIVLKEFHAFIRQHQL